MGSITIDLMIVMRMLHKAMKVLKKNTNDRWKSSRPRFVKLIPSGNVVTNRQIFPSKDVGHGFR